MILTREESDRFVQWLDLRIADNKAILEQFKKWEDLR